MQTTQATADYIRFLSSHDGITHIVSSTSDANSSTLALTQKCLASGVDFPVPLPDGTVGINVPDGVPEKLLSFAVVVDAITENEGRDAAPAEEVEADNGDDEEEDISVAAHDVAETPDVTEDAQPLPDEPEMSAAEPAIEPQEDVGESVDEPVLEETGLEGGQDAITVAPVDDADETPSEIDAEPLDSTEDTTPSEPCEAIEPSETVDEIDVSEPQPMPSEDAEPAALEMDQDPVASEADATAEILEDTHEDIQPIEEESAPQTDLESEPEEPEDPPIEADLPEPPQELEAQAELPVDADDEPQTDLSVEGSPGEDDLDAPHVSEETTQDPQLSDATPQDEAETTANDTNSLPDSNELAKKLDRIVADQAQMFDLLSDIQNSVNSSLGKPTPQPDARELNRGMARLLTVFSTALRSFEDALGAMAQNTANEDDLGEGASIHSSTAPYIRTLASLQEIMAIQMSRLLEDRSKTGDAGLNEMILDIKQTMAELTAQKTEYEKKQEAA